MQSDDHPLGKWLRFGGNIVALTYFIAVFLFAWYIASADLFPIWAAGQGILQGHNPYGPEVQQIIERDWNNFSRYEQAGVSYPLPLILALLPFAFLPYQAAERVFVIVVLFSIVGVSRLIKLHWGSAIGFAPLVFGALLAQITSLWVVLAMVAIYAVEQRKSFLIGLCIALLPMKPQSGLLIALALYAWCIWRDRKALYWATGLGAVIWLGSVALMPTWPLAWLGQVQKYADLIPSMLFVTYLPALPFIIAILWSNREPFAWLTMLNYILLPQVGGYSPAMLLPLLRYLEGWVLWVTVLSTNLIWLALPIPSDPALITWTVWLPLGVGTLLQRYLAQRKTTQPAQVA